MDIFSKIIEADLVDPLRLIHPTHLPNRRVDQGAQRRIHQNSTAQIQTFASPFSVDPRRLIHPTHPPTVGWIKEHSDGSTKTTS